MQDIVPARPRFVLHRVVLAVLALLPGWLAAAPTADPIDRILIIVNDEAVTARDVDNRLEAVRRRLAAQKVPLPPDALLRKQVMERMVDERLQVQLATAAGLKVTDEQLERAIQQIAGQNNKTPDQFQKEAASQPGGWPAVRNEIREQLLVQQLVDREVQNRVAVSDAEVEAFLANRTAHSDSEYNLSHILITIPESASPDAIERARQKAEQLHADLKKGADFAQLAAANSQGQKALEGGNLGWKRSGELPDLFVNALNAIQPGEVSEVLRSPAGFHILRLNDRRGGSAAVNVVQTHARHILIKTTELVSPAEARRRAALLRERIAAGEDFAQAARANSDDIGSASSGGDLGWVNPGQTVPDFEKAMDALKPRETSEPVRSPFGVHIIQVLERRERDVSHEREVANARNQIHARKADERYEQWLRQLRDEAFVDYRADKN